MNKELFDPETGELIARTYTPFLTRYHNVPPTAIKVEGESMVDTSLYQPLKDVVQRCERAGMIRQLIEGAKNQEYDSREPLGDDVLDVVEQSTLIGDVLSDSNLITDAYMSKVDLGAAPEASKSEEVSEASSDLPAVSDQKNGVSDDE